MRILRTENADLDDGSCDTFIEGRQPQQVESCASLSEVQLSEKQPAITNSRTRNLRNVWEIGPEPSSEAHFATYPTALVKPCILSSTSERGNCAKCGKPWTRVIERPASPHDGSTDSAYPEGSTAKRLALLRQAARERGEEYSNDTRTLCWRPSCSCGIAETQPAVVLDPFAGTSTTGVVAQMLGRRGVMIDASEDYVRLSVKRLSKLSLPMEVKA